MCPSEDTSVNSFWRHQDQLLLDTKTALHSAIFQMNGPIKKKEWGPHRYLRIDTSFLVSRQAEHELMLLHWENHTLHTVVIFFANPYLLQWEVQLLFLIEFDIEPCSRFLFAFEPPSRGFELHPHDMWAIQECTSTPQY